MPRKAASADCMFCEQTPCICNPPEVKKAPRKKAAPKKSVHGDVPPAADHADGTRTFGPSPNQVIDAMRLAATQASQDEVERDAEIAAARAALLHDPDTVAAIAALRDVLHSDEIETIEHATTPEAARVRAELWKERRRAEHR